MPWPREDGAQYDEQLETVRWGLHRLSDEDLKERYGIYLGLCFLKSDGDPPQVWPLQLLVQAWKEMWKRHIDRKAKK